jgi:hypothetical protein
VTVSLARILHIYSVGVHNEADINKGYKKYEYIKQIYTG